jgi:hypothetical protein
MTNDIADKPQAQSGRQAMSTIQLKRQVTVKSLVTEEFRQKAKNELSEELKLIDAQLAQLQNQYQATLKQLETVANSGQDVSRQVEQLNLEAQERQNQLANVRIQVANNLANIDRVQNGDHVVTGVLENYVTVEVGDNIYEKIRGAEIIVEDGIVRSING